MKHFNLTAALLLAATIAGYAQGQQPVVDTHPSATIYIYDPQTSQEVLAESDDAVLFKDALIELANNTNEGRRVIRTGGHRTTVITQAAPDQGNAFQITMDTKLFGRVANLYTFSYNVDQNTLYYLDPNTQSWTPELVQGNNVVLLNNCLALGRFNDPQSWNEQANDDNGDEVDVQANTAPPVLQDEDQPECPVDGYLWQPGYWAFNPNAGNYYWVRGEWVEPPTPGYLWTPPYWGFEAGVYGFHRGYWGVTVGFYGGINYGYGYVGHGFYGGRWEGGHFRYNTAVVRVNVKIVKNVYVDRTVVVNKTVVKKSFNGPGGVDAKPTKDEVVANKEKRVRDNKQDPSAPKVTNNGKRGGNENGNAANPTGNTNKTPGKDIGNQKNNGNNNNGQKNNGADNNNQKNNSGNGGNVNNSQKTPDTDDNSPKVPGKDISNKTPKAPGNGPAVPKVPGSGEGNGRANGTNEQRQQGQGQNNGQRQNVQPQNAGQRQQGQGQNNGGQKANKQTPPAKQDKNPPAKDKKNP